MRERLANPAEGEHDGQAQGPHGDVEVGLAVRERGDEDAQDALRAGDAVVHTWLNEPAIDRLSEIFHSVADDENTRGVIFTGTGKFFSFGLDVPEISKYSPVEFTAFLEKFSTLYEYLFHYPKPLIACLNGHTVGGGCMLAITCDYRLMVPGKSKISLNEISTPAKVD